jgi:hypothetical protein
MIILALTMILRSSHSMIYSRIKEILYSPMMTCARGNIKQKPSLHMV